MSDDLARRAVACNGWRWVPGMLSTMGRVVRVGAHGPIFWGERYPRALAPDLTDPATLGCLLALVREAYSCRSFVCVQGPSKFDSDDMPPWTVEGRDCVPLGGGASEAGALVTALEAASKATDS